MFLLKGWFRFGTFENSQADSNRLRLIFMKIQATFYMLCDLFIFVFLKVMQPSNLFVTYLMFCIFKIDFKFFNLFWLSFFFNCYSNLGYLRLIMFIRNKFFVLKSGRLKKIKPLHLFLCWSFWIKDTVVIIKNHIV